ncbi:5'-adenylylsulfate reductase-like 7 [Chenopodium quinoa]|uniref:5'-adenylylsulfate reductase-like 7 n=1 Tax=Chenopodium quinoa TaxID=63459 RepID=UPI000B77F18A|nr:5'-adenylylsulfate reductase-like 7 [Chenopodium quinoa]
MELQIPLTTTMLLLLLCLVTPSLTFCHPLTCNSSPNTHNFLHLLHRQCPRQIPLFNPPIQVDGENLEQILRSTPKDVYTAVLFYDSRSPFSNSMSSKFDILSSMFPGVGHIAVELSMVMPSLLSRFGIHSLPALFIVNQAEQIRYYGPKELHSLAHFYKRITGFGPAEYHTHNEVANIMNGEIVPEPWYWSSWREIIVKEPYLVFAILFLVLRGFLCICPEIWSCVTALWMLCMCQLNLGVLGESNQLLARVAHVMDVKRVWSKLKQCKIRNFQEGARSARVWASSLASVSLGESSSARPSSSIES